MKVLDEKYTGISLATVSNKLRNAYRSPPTKPLCSYHRRVT